MSLKTLRFLCFLLFNFFYFLCCGFAWLCRSVVAKPEGVEPPEFGDDMATLEKMLVDAVEGPHSEWTPQDLEDIARRVSEMA